MFLNYSEIYRLDLLFVLPIVSGGISLGKLAGNKIMRKKNGNFHLESHSRG